jgi:regulator of cell morphogenesis and NO signaling
MHRATENIARLVRDRYSFNFPDLKEEFPSLPSDFFNDMVIVFQDPDRFNPKTFQKHSVELILTYLKTTHKFYLNKRMTELEMAIDNLKRSQYEPVQRWHPFMSHFLQGFQKDMIHHIQEEEKNLFPYIEVLLEARKSKKLNYTAQQKICLMSFVLDHDDHAEEELHKLVEAMDHNLHDLSDSFSFRMLLNHLKTFELDLRIHARMEEEVLIPRSIVLEKEILNDKSIHVNPGM